MKTETHQSNSQRLMKLYHEEESASQLTERRGTDVDTYSRYKLMAAMIYSSGESRPLIKYVS